MIQEHWLLYFCEKEEKKQLLQWLDEEGLSRPREFQDRLAHAEKMRKMSNDWFNKDDFRRALHCIMGAVHALDFIPSVQMSHSPEERAQVSLAMLPVMSNAAMIFLKRGDFFNAVQAASAGLRCAQKVPDEEANPFRAKLLFRRGLARAEKSDARDLDAARADLAEAAKLEPQNKDIRTCLDNCKSLTKKEAKQSPLRYNPPVSAKKDSTDGDAAKGSEKEPPQLSPFAEKVAEVVGRCLGRTIRRYKKIRQGSRQALLMPMFVMLVVTLIVGFAMHFTTGLPYPPGAV